MKKRNLILFFLYCLVAFTTVAQDEESMERKPHRLSVMMANSHIPRADDVNGGKTFFIVPTWGVNYDYWLSERWAVGLHNDIILQQYKIEDREDGRIIERSFPISVSATALFKATEHWIFLAGMGREFEKHESFNLINVGVEYGVELPNDWELNFNLIYEDKFKVYDSWMFGIGFSKFLKSDRLKIGK